MTIDLTQLPAPEVIEELSFDEIRDEMLDDLASRDPELDIQPADPSYRVLEVAAYREMLNRQRANERIRRLLAAFATGSDLDHIGVTYYATERLVVDEGDPQADPPVPPTLESDEDYLRRFLLAPDGWSSAGPEDGYVYFALSADPDVKDAKPNSPAATEVVIVVLSRTGDGSADQPLLDAVEAACSAKTVRPQTDLVSAVSATIKPYEIKATLEMEDGPDPDLVRDLAQQRAEEFADKQHRIGRTVFWKAVSAALWVEGVRRVHLELDADVVCDETEAPFCELIEVTIDE